MPVKVIVTGATGMVGEGVLLECLAHPEVTTVLSISRRASGHTHVKLRELIIADFFDLTSIEAQLSGCDACFFCLGTTSLGKSFEEYRRSTYDLTLHFAELLAKKNPALIFCYVSGKGTDNSEHGSIAQARGWAQIKGATEKALLRILPQSVMFRPAFILPAPGQMHVLRVYRLLAWIYPIGRKLYPAGFCTIREIGVAMIHAAMGRELNRSRTLEVQDIVTLAVNK